MIAEKLRQLRYRVEELERQVDYHRQCHEAGHDAVLQLVQKLADLEAKVGSIQNDLCCIQHIDTGVPQ